MYNTGRQDCALLDAVFKKVAESRRHTKFARVHYLQVYSVYLLYSYKRSNTDAEGSRRRRGAAGPQFTCFTSTKSQILTRVHYLQTLPDLDTVVELPAVLFYRNSFIKHSMTGLLDLEILSIGESGRILEGPPGAKFTTQFTCFTSTTVGFGHPLYG